MSEATQKIKRKVVPIILAIVFLWTVGNTVVIVQLQDEVVDNWVENIKLKNTIESMKRINKVNEASRDIMCEYNYRSLLELIGELHK